MNVTSSGFDIMTIVGKIVKFCIIRYADNFFSYAKQTSNEYLRSY